MITRLHILLTYNCSLRCKHCYVFSDQRAVGKISLSQVSHFLNEGRKLPGIKWIYFGGGEPFTQYPLLLKAIQRARKLDYDVGVVTNGYFARTVEAGVRFLRPLALMGVKDIRISNDFLHYKNPETSPAKRALKAAKKLGIPTTLVHTAHPGVQELPGNGNDSADNVLEKRLMMTGRAVETLSEGLPRSNWQEFASCPRTDLTDPEEVFIDAYGYVQICPGISIGNACEAPLHDIIEKFAIQSHAIIQLLETKGPSGLMKDSAIHPDAEYVNPCHCCYSIRRELIDQYPDWFAPRHVYGF
jgi:hypothetical protein